MIYRGLPLTLFLPNPPLQPLRLTRLPQIKPPHPLMRDRRPLPPKHLEDIPVHYGCLIFRFVWTFRCIVFPLELSNRVW